ncbi:hypothetical protein F5883DRAFT_641202 [Diaporthe sp. PMI_573]|nr:hypothetical protein F5883DRAFT_641202 [Diaporthaceae sp. PMI_573]
MSLKKVQQPAELLDTKREVDSEVVIIPEAKHGSAARASPEDKKSRALKPWRHTPPTAIEVDEAATNPSVGINSAIDYYTKETGNTKLADNNTDMANDNTRAAEDNTSIVSWDRPQCSKWALDCYTDSDDKKYRTTAWIEAHRKRLSPTPPHPILNLFNTPSSATSPLSEFGHHIHKIVWSICEPTNTGSSLLGFEIACLGRPSLGPKNLPIRFILKVKRRSSLSDDWSTCTQMANACYAALLEKGISDVHYVVLEANQASTLGGAQIHLNNIDSVVLRNRFLRWNGRQS